MNLEADQSEADQIKQTLSSGENEISISLNNVKVTKSGDSYIVKTNNNVELGKITILPQHKADNNIDIDIDNDNIDIERASNHSINIKNDLDDNSVISVISKSIPLKQFYNLSNSSDKSGGNILKKKSKRKTKKGKPSRLRVKNLNKHKKNTQKVPF
jgi:hypothetical protein